MEIPVTVIYGIVITILVIFVVLYVLFLNDVKRTEETLEIKLPRVVRQLLLGNFILTLITLGLSLIFMLL